MIKCECLNGKHFAQSHLQQSPKIDDQHMWTKKMKKSEEPPKKSLKMVRLTISCQNNSGK